MHWPVPQSAMFVGLFRQLSEDRFPIYDLAFLAASARPLELLRDLCFGLRPIPRLRSRERFTLRRRTWIHSSGLRCPQIGRASCRERVCQYVEISGVDVSL